MTFTVKTRWGDYPNCILKQAQYTTNNHIAISIVSLEEGPFSNLTVNLDDTKRYPENYGFVDTNNFPEAESLILQLGIGEETGIIGGSGFCLYPLYKFDYDAIKKYTEKRAV